MLAQFFWLNVICINVWRNVRYVHRNLCVYVPRVLIQKIANSDKISYRQNIPDKFITYPFRNIACEYVEEATGLLES